MKKLFSRGKSSKKNKTTPANNSPAAGQSQVAQGSSSSSEEEQDGVYKINLSDLERVQKYERFYNKGEEMDTSPEFGYGHLQGICKDIGYMCYFEPNKVNPHTGIMHHIIRIPKEQSNTNQARDIINTFEAIKIGTISLQSALKQNTPGKKFERMKILSYSNPNTGTRPETDTYLVISMKGDKNAKKWDKKSQRKLDAFRLEIENLYEAKYMHAPQNNPQQAQPAWMQPPVQPTQQPASPAVSADQVVLGNLKRFLTGLTSQDKEGFPVSLRANRDQQHGDALVVTFAKKEYAEKFAQELKSRYEIRGQRKDGQKLVRQEGENFTVMLSEANYKTLDQKLGGQNNPNNPFQQRGFQSVLTMLDGRTPQQQPAVTPVVPAAAPTAAPVVIPPAAQPASVRPPVTQSNTKPTAQPAPVPARVVQGSSGQQQPADIYGGVRIVPAEFEKVQAAAAIETIKSLLPMEQFEILARSDGGIQVQGKEGMLKFSEALEKIGVKSNIAFIGELNTLLTDDDTKKGQYYGLVLSPPQLRTIFKNAIALKEHLQDAFPSLASVPAASAASSSHTPSTSFVAKINAQDEERQENSLVVDKLKGALSELVTSKNLWLGVHKNPQYGDALKVGFFNQKDADEFVNNLKSQYEIGGQGVGGKKAVTKVGNDYFVLLSEANYEKLGLKAVSHDDTSKQRDFQGALTAVESLISREK